jgi:hypothetical protein
MRLTPHEWLMIVVALLLLAGTTWLASMVIGF